jgi:hypothetical protein
LNDPVTWRFSSFNITAVESPAMLGSRVCISGVQRM